MFPVFEWIHKPITPSGSRLKGYCDWLCVSVRLCQVRVYLSECDIARCTDVFVRIHCATSSSEFNVQRLRPNLLRNVFVRIHCATSSSEFTVQRLRPNLLCNVFVRIHCATSSSESTVQRLRPNSLCNVFVRIHCATFQLQRINDGYYQKFAHTAPSKRLGGLFRQND